MQFRIFTKERVIPLLCALVIMSCLVHREFYTPVWAEEAKAKAKAKAAPKQEEQPPQPIRTETITYDAWTVSCRDTPDGRTKKVCSAMLQMIATQQNQQVAIGAWIIGRNNEGALVSIVQTPMPPFGVMTSKAFELKLGNANPLTISYSSCTPQRCSGQLMMNDSVVRTMVAAANDPAIITIWRPDGETFTLTIQSIKGIDKAILDIR